MKLFDSTRIPILGRALDAYAARQRVISSNIANIGTAGYRSKAVSFQDEMTGAMEQPLIAPAKTNERHMDIAGAASDKEYVQVVDAASPGSPPSDPAISGVNDVDIDNEMAEMAKNQIRYKFASRLMGETFRGLQKSIKGTL